MVYWTTLYPETSTVHYRGKCYFSYWTCMFTCPFTFRNKNQSFSSVFWARKWPEVLSWRIHRQNLWFMRSSMKVQMTLSWWVNRSSDYRPRKLTNTKSSSCLVLVHKFVVGLCLLTWNRTHWLQHHWSSIYDLKLQEK